MTYANKIQLLYLTFLNNNLPHITHYQSILCNAILEFTFFSMKIAFHFKPDNILIANAAFSLA